MNSKPKRSTLQRESILNTSRTLFLKVGYDRTSMREIARACGFEPPNIYNYFHSKEQLLYEVLKDTHIRAVSSVKHLEDDNVTSPVEQLRSLVKSEFDVVVSITKTARMTLDSELRNLSDAHRRRIMELRSEYDRILRKIIRRGIDNGDFADIDEKLVGFFIASIIIRSVVWFSPNGRLPANEITDTIFKFVLHGLKGAGSKV